MNDEITRFNMFKKLAQLNKVVEYLTVHLHERYYQIDTLRTRYKKAENEIFKNYEQKIGELKKDLDYVDDVSSYARNYNSKYDIIVTAFLEKSQLKSKELEEIAINTFVDLDDVKAEIAKVSRELDSEINFLTNELGQMNTELVLKIKKLETENKNTIAQHDKQAEEKYKKEELNSENKIKKLKEDMADELQKEKDDYKENRTAKPLLDLKPMRNWNLKISNMKEAIEKAKEETEKLKEKHKIMMKKLIPKKDAVLNDGGQSNEDRENEKENMERKLEVEVASMTLELQQLKNTCEEAKKGNAAKLLLLQNEYAAIQHSNKAIVQDKMKEVTVANNSNESDYEEFAKQLKKEENSLSFKNKRDEQEIDKEIAQLAHDLEYQKVSLKEDVEHSNDDVKDEQAIMDRMNKTEEERYENMKNTIISKHKEYKKQQEKALIEKNALVFKYRKAEQEKKMLCSQLDSLHKINSTSLENLELSENEEKNMMKKTFEKLVNDETSKADESFNAKTGFSQQSIKENEELFNKEYNELSASLEDKRTQELEQIKLSFADDDIKNMIDKYSEEAKRLEDELDSFDHSVATNDEDEERIINELKSKKESLKKIHKEEKNNLLRSFKKELELEANRHDSFLISLLNESSKQLVVDEEMNTIRNEAMVVLNQLEAEITKETNELKHYKLLFKPMNKAVVDCEEIQQLNKEIEELRIEKAKKIQEANEETERAIKEGNENIENAKLDVIHGKEDCDKELEAFNNKMHDLFNNETERRKNLRKTTEEKEKQFQETLIASEGKLNEDFKKEKSQMNEQIDAARKVFNEDEATRKEQQNENTKTLEEKMNNEEETLKKEIEELKKVRANSNPGLEEELNNATKKRDDAKYQFTHRPMREKEKNIIDNLNEIVDQKTKYLMLIGRDLLAYRARLLQQEGDINCRFGNDPIIGNCNVKITAQSRPRTAIASPLHSNSRPMTATLVQTPKGKKTQRLSSLFQKTV